MYMYMYMYVYVYVYIYIYSIFLISICLALRLISWEVQPEHLNSEAEVFKPKPNPTQHPQEAGCQLRNYPCHSAAYFGIQLLSENCMLLFIIEQAALRHRPQHSVSRWHSVWSVALDLGRLLRLCDVCGLRR